MFLGLEPFLVALACYLLLKIHQVGWKHRQWNGNKLAKLLTEGFNVSVK